MKKILSVLTVLLILSGCSGEPDKIRPNYSFSMRTNLKDHSFISFKAKVFVKTEKQRKKMERKVERTKQALRMKFRVLIPQQVRNEKKVAKLVKIILEGRKGRDIEVVITDFKLKKRE